MTVTTNKILVFVHKLRLEREILILRFNWLSITAILLTILFCYFGYGSNQTIIVRCSFFLLPLVLYLNKTEFQKFQDRISIRRIDLLVLLTFFITLLTLGRDFIFRYPGGDEGAYSVIAFQTPISLIERMEVFGTNFTVANGVRISSAIVTCLIFISLVFNSRIRPTILVLILSLSIAFSGIVFNAFGGVPAGYSKLNTLPLVFGGFFLGINGLAMHITMVVIFTLFIWAYWRHLTTIAPKRSFLAFIAIFSFVSMSSTTYLSSFIDHSFYFIIFASIPTLNIFLKERSNPERWIGLLSIGVFFRITILIVLACYIIFILRSHRKSQWLFTTPVITIPYLFVFSTTGNSGIVNLEPSEQGSGNFSETAQGFMHSLTLNHSWANLIYLGIIFCFAISLELKLSFKIITFTFLSYVTYFEFLNSEIVGNPKYQLEWLSTLILTLIGFLLVRLKVSSHIRVFYILTSLSLLTNVWQNLALPQVYSVFNSSVNVQKIHIDRFNIQTFYLVNPIHDYEAFLDRVPSGYRGTCLIMGTTYGEILEVMAQRTRGEIEHIKKLRIELEQLRVLGIDKAIKSEFDNAAKAGVSCLITSANPEKKRDLTFREWDLFYEAVGSKSNDTLRIFLKPVQLGD